MTDAYHDIAKAELHLHLEGSLEPETLSELHPGLSRDEVAARYRYENFDGFIESFKWVAGHLNTPDDYRVATRKLLQRLAGQNVSYVEITLSAGVMLWRGIEFEPVFQAVTSAAQESRVEVAWVLDAVRQFGVEHAMAVAKLAAERVHRGVVAFGIGGSEELGPVRWFGEVFEFARSHGLHLTVHAGETMGPESVWGALRLGAERIGHGISAIEDPRLVSLLRERSIPLEVCISSNLATGAVRDLRSHPVRRLYEAGVPVVLNTDDPAMFHTCLTREYEIAEREFGFSRAEIVGLIENGFRYAFRKSRE